MGNKLGAIHVAKKDLGLDDEAYRDVLERTIGRRSARGLSEAQLGRVLDEFKRLGWHRTSRRKPAGGPQAAKIRALWIGLHNLGEIEDAGERALNAFVLRQTHVANVAWLDAKAAHKVIEALRSWATRAGWNVPPDDGHGARVNLLSAQWARLAALGAVQIAETAALHRWLDRIPGPRVAGPDYMDDARLDAAARKLGRWIWQRRQEQAR